MAADVDSDEESNEDKIQDDKDSTPMDPRILQVGRAAYGRSIITPVNIPVDMVQKLVQQEQPQEENRPHYVQPRSIRDN